MSHILSNEKSAKEIEIIDAARTVFKRFGYKKTSMVDIAEEINLNQASLYYYFKNKEEIFIEAFIAEFNEFAAQIQPIIFQKSSIKEKLIMYNIKKLRFFKENKLSQQISDLNYKKISQEKKDNLLKVTSSEYKVIKTLLDSAIQNGEIIEVDTAQLTKVIIQLFRGVMYGDRLNILFTQKIPSFEDLANEIRQSIDFLLLGIQIKNGD